MTTTTASTRFAVGDRVIILRAPWRIDADMIERQVIATDGKVFSVRLRGASEYLFNCTTGLQHDVRTELQAIAFTEQEWADRQEWIRHATTLAARDVSVPQGDGVTLPLLRAMVAATES